MSERRNYERRKHEQLILWEKCHFDERRKCERHLFNLTIPLVQIQQTSRTIA